MSDINPFAILDSLGIANCTGATRIHGGWYTTIWQIHRGEESFALRLFPAGHQSAARHEATMMRAARDAGINVPGIHAEGEWNDRPVLLLDWCDGRTVMQEMRRRPWNIRRLGYRFGQRQAEIHRVEYTHPELDSQQWITRFGPVDDDLRSRLIDVQLQPARLLHLDYHPLNVMVSQREIGCILDWCNAMPGDPRADVARTWSILRLMPLNPGRPEPVTESARRLLAAGWLRGYEDAAGPLQDMNLFKVWAGFAMVHDLQQYVDKPEIWIEQRHVDSIRQRVNELRQRAGIA